MKLIGILGGMGPQATLSLMQRILELTPAREDAGHVPLLVCNDPRIPDRTAAIRGEGPSPLPALIEAARRLQAGGVDVIAMPCNTAHYVLPSLRAAVDVPFLDLIDEVSLALTQTVASGAAVGILATDGAIEAGIYRRGLAAHGLRALDPTPEDQRRVMETIYGPRGVKGGCLAPEQAETLREVIHNLEDRGAQAVVAGCTEIPVVLDRFKPALNLPVICSIDTLARAIIREAGKASSR